MQIAGAMIEEVLGIKLKQLKRPLHQQGLYGYHLLSYKSLHLLSRVITTKGWKDDNSNRKNNRILNNIKLRAQ